MTKLKLILLLVISLASKLTTADEGLFQSELQNPQLIPLANKLNLKETTLFQGSNYLNSNNDVLVFENAAVKDDFQKEQAKLMSFKKPNAIDVDSKLEVARRLNNSLRMNRLQIIENTHETAVPKMMASYLRSKNRNQLRKLSEADLLPQELSPSVKIAEIPSFLKVNNHKRLLNKLEDDSASQISVKNNDNIRTLSGNSRDKKYFQSIEYTTNRMNNPLRNNRLKLTKSSPSELSDMSTLLAMYIRKKMETERSQLVNRGIIPEDYDETVTEAPSLRPSPRANQQPVNKPRVRAQIVPEEEEEEDEEEEEEYEIATTKKSPSKANFVLVIDEKKATKQRGSNKPKVKAPEPEYESYEYEIKPKNRAQANKNNNKGLNNQNRSNQARVNRPTPKPVVQTEDYYYDEEEVITTTQAPTTTTTTTKAPRRRYNPRGNPNARTQPRRRVKPVEEPVYSNEEEEEEEEEVTTTKQSRLNQGFKNKTFRRKTTTLAPELAVETTTVSVVPETTTQTLVEQTTVTTTEAPTTVAASTPGTEPVVEQIAVAETTTIETPVEETTTLEQVLIEETATTDAPLETTTQTVQDVNNRNLKAKRKFKQRVMIDKTSSSQSANEARPRINANAARQRITPTPSPVRKQSTNLSRQRINQLQQRLNRQNDNMQLRASPGSGQRFNNAFNRNRLTAAQYY